MGFNTKIVNQHNDTYCEATPIPWERPIPRRLTPAEIADIQRQAVEKKAHTQFRVPYPGTKGFDELIR